MGNASSSPRGRALWGRPVLFSLLLLLTTAIPTPAQDASTGAIRGTVSDTTGARIALATVTVTNSQTGVKRALLTGEDGEFAIQLLPPGEYTVRVAAPNMAPRNRSGLRVEVGGVVALDVVLAVAGSQETVSVSAAVPLVEPQTSAISTVLDERAIGQLPLNGRRFTDLALLTTDAAPDPRGLTSASNGDLAFGGVRGFQSSFLVDGVDNNNAFFSQARGRYRAPYQFSNEVIQEFRVSSSTYGAELGRAGGAVVNVVTKSGSNYWHGTAFYFLRDGRVSARHPFLDFKPPDRQHQFGGTVGGPLRRNRAFIYAGFDQHIFHVPTVVQFLNGFSVLTPQPGDYESTDAALVFAAAEDLSALGGQFRSALVGNTGFVKFDFSLSPRHLLAARLSTSRYYGENNVFFDPASPITNHAISENGEERVSTESAVVSLTSALSAHATSHLRLQFSRDLQESAANSADVRTRIDQVIEGFGRSSILPRRTREHRVHLAETLSLEGRRHSWKFGGDFNLVWIYNFFPSLFGGQYIFDTIRVNPFTFQPMTYGMKITPLRAWAHQVPRYYIQNFGSADSHPDTREYSFFAQDSIRITDHLALNLGIRYDLQTFRSDALISNPLWPDSGKLPLDSNNFAPRVGFAYSIGDKNPLVVRGGYGLFYTRIPQIYTSTVETDNGLAQSHLFLDNADYFDHLVFPGYPSPVVACPVTASTCAPPSSLAGYLTTEISAFSPRFQTPFVQQASLSVEREVARRFAISGSYLYVHGQHLIRALDANLPPPLSVSYPVYDDAGANFLGDYYDVASFATWQFAPSLTCPFPPCINPLARPIAALGAINVFESAASSVYHGFTVSARRRMTSGFYFRLGYTFGRATDDGQDALVAGRPATVQNAYAPQFERGRSVTDQRHRFVFSWIYEPRPFSREHALLHSLFNDWRLSGIVTVGSGRPVNAQVIGDANRDANSSNDRLPGYARNAFNGPDYATTDLRLTRRFYLGDRVKLEAMAEFYNLFNRSNQRVDISDDGFLNAAGQFVPLDKTIGAYHFPAYYTRSSSFLVPTNAYAPRQLQFALKLVF